MTRVPCPICDAPPAKRAQLRGGLELCTGCGYVIALDDAGELVPWATSNKSHPCGIWALVALLACGLAMTEAPKSPKLLHVPGVASARMPLEFDVLITPHPDIRFVTADAWEARPMRSPFVDLVPDLEMPVLYELGEFIHTSDAQPVTELNQRQRVFHYRWTQGLEDGIYFLVARIATRDFRPMKEAKHLLRVS